MNTAIPSSIVVVPCRTLQGAVRVPGDKSISHRIALLGALSGGVTAARGFLRSADSETTLQALRRLGTDFEFDGDTLRIRGAGAAWRAPREPLDMGNSGTALRLLAGLLAGQRFTVTLTGDASLSSRPMRRIQEPLERMGARVELLGPDGRPPVRITGGALRAIAYDLPVASAQVKSCVLLAGLFAEGTTVVTEPQPTRDHTERLLQAIGAPLTAAGGRIALTGYGAGGPRFQGRAWTVPGDFSSAAFWLTAAAALGGPIRVEGVGLNPRRCALLNVLRRMGARIAVTPAADGTACEELGSVTVAGGRLRGAEVGPDEAPDLIDELPLVAMAGALAQGQTVIRGAAELRVKESDRIAIIAGLLNRLGVNVEELPDGMIVHGGSRIRGAAAVESHGDHRIPMALTVLALAADQPLEMRDVACVNKSYPEFWSDLQRLGGRVEFHPSH